LLRARRALEKIWNWLGEGRRTIEILVALLLFLLLTLLLPQSSVPASNLPVFTQWVAQLRPLLGNWVRPLRYIGLLTVRSSLLFRIILGYLGLLVAVRADYLREHWHTVNRSIRRTILLFCIGSFLVIAGWAGQMLWGWAVPETVNWPHTPIVVPEHGLSLSPHNAKSIILTGKYGIYLLRTSWAVGLEITAADESGNPLSMLRSSKDELHENLQLTLTGTPPEAFFLIPETELVYRLHQLENRYNAPVYVQVYRSASGELLAEVPLKQNEDIVVETTHISVVRQQLPRYRILYDPGAPIEAGGLVILLVLAFVPASKILDNSLHEDEIRGQSSVTA